MKKTYLYLLFLGLILVSCGGDGGDEGESIDFGDNTAPTVPNQVFPLNNTLCTDNNVLFEWNASTDSEGNAITYRIEISDNNSFLTLLKNETSFAESKLIFLEKGKAYYWRIKAVDNRNAESSYSPIMEFITEGEGTINHVPFAAALLSPVLNSEVSGTTVNISWSASDVDGDPLSFDVYLDTNENPTTKVSENQTETTYNAANLASATKYYFKVVVKDDKGAISIGQVWSFTTK
jgi:fibronectin type 3 domain-containing protein